jgi:transposase
LHTWLWKYPQGGGRPPSQLNADHLYEEIKHLKKENALLKEERDSLKKRRRALLPTVGKVRLNEATLR